MMPIEGWCSLVADTGFDVEVLRAPDRSRWPAESPLPGEGLLGLDVTEPEAAALSRRIRLAGGLGLLVPARYLRSKDSIALDQARAIASRAFAELAARTGHQYGHLEDSDENAVLFMFS